MRGRVGIEQVVSHLPHAAGGVAGGWMVRRTPTVLPPPPLQQPFFPSSPVRSPLTRVAKEVKGPLTSVPPLVMSAVAVPGAPDPCRDT